MKRINILVVLLFICTAGLYSQQRDLQNYEGPFRLTETEEGKAKFTYYEDSEGERIMSGDFEYRFEHFDPQSVFYQRQFNGTYKDGLKHGRWVYANNEFDINVNTVTARLELRAELNGSRSKLEGNYIEGKANGAWKLEEQKILNGRVAGIGVSANMNFREGKMVGEFSFQQNDEENPINLSGSFNEDHFFDGVWKMDYIADSIPIVETRVYDNGFLLSLKLEDRKNDITLFDLDYDHVKEKLTKVRAGEKDLGFAIGDRRFGFLFDDGFPDFSQKEVSQYAGNEMLVSVMGRFTDREILGMNLPGVEELETGGTRRFEYTYRESEQQALEEVGQTLNQYISDIQKFVNNSTLALNRQRSDSLAFTFKFLDNTLDRFLILQENVELLQGEEFKYQSRENFYQDGIEGIYSKDTITYTYDEEERGRVIDNQVSLSNGDGIIFNIQEYVNRKVEIVDRLDPFVRQQIKEIERDMVSQQLEDDMLMYIDSVAQVYDVGRGAMRLDEHQVPLTHDLVTLHRNYQKRLDSKMQVYSTVEDFEEKQQVGLRIVGLSQAYIETYFIMGRLPQKLETLNQSYTKLSYNPYMDRYDIPTRIKRNIYFAAIDHLIPHYQQQILAEDDFEELRELTQELERVFERLFEIAEMGEGETKSMERRLRRESNPDRIKRLLGV